MPGKALPDGTPGPNLACAVIIKQVDERTRSKTSINELPRQCPMTDALLAEHDLARQLIQCPSVTPDEAGTLDSLEEYLTGYGFNVTPSIW